MESSFHRGEAGMVKAADAAYRDTAPGEIQTMFSQLRESAAVTDKMVAELVQRIAPVMRAEPVTDNAKEVPRCGALTPMGAEIDGVVSRHRDTQRRLEMALRLLELP